MNHYQILSAGSNAKGQLGQNNLEDSHSFRSSYFVLSDGESLTTICPGKPQSICCGSNHTILLLQSTLTSRNQIWGCGDTQYTLLRSLNPNSFSPSLVFQRLDDQILSSLGLEPHQFDFHAVAASWNTTFIVIRPTNTTQSARRSRDILVSFGSNDSGNLGLGHMPQKLRYTSMPSQIKIWELFFSIYGKEMMGFKIMHLAAGVRHIILVVRLFVGDLDIVRTLGWGACRHGQLGDVSQPNNHILCRPTFLSLDVEIESLALGNQHTIFLSNTHHVSGLGSNRKGQLNDVNEISNGIQIGTTWNGSYVVCRPSNETTPSWHVFSMGSGNNGQLGRSIGSSNTIYFPFDAASRQFVKLMCGSEHIIVCLRKENGKNEVWGWGWNEHGNLGIGNTENVEHPSLIYQTGEDEEVINIWAGYGTSWIATAKIKQIT